MNKDIVIPAGQELPSQAAWDEMVRAADRVQILEGGTISHIENGRKVGRPLRTKVLFETCRLEDLKSLRTCVRFRDDAEGGICMCMGQLAFVFFRGEERLAILGFHHGESFRWDRWFGDGPLIENQGILDWLSERGIDGPAQEYAETQRRRALSEQQAQRWFAAMPACLVPLEQQIRQGGMMEEALFQQALKAMEEAYPHPQERARVLFRWYGQGNGPWAHFPGYEAEPRKMLDCIPIEVLIHALDTIELSAEEWEGAARYFSSGYFQKRHGPAWKQLSEPLCQRLLEHVLQAGAEHEDSPFLPSNRDIAFKAFAPRT